MNECLCEVSGCGDCDGRSCTCLCGDIKYVQNIFAKISENLKNRTSKEHDRLCPIMKNYGEPGAFPLCCCFIIELARKETREHFIENGREGYTNWDYRN